MGVILPKNPLFKYRGNGVESRAGVYNIMMKNNTPLESISEKPIHLWITGKGDYLGPFNYEEDQAFWCLKAGASEKDCLLDIVWLLNNAQPGSKLVFNSWSANLVIKLHCIKQALDLKELVELDQLKSIWSIENEVVESIGLGLVWKEIEIYLIAPAPACFVSFLITDDMEKGMGKVKRTATTRHINNIIDMIDTASNIKLVCTSMDHDPFRANELYLKNIILPMAHTAFRDHANVLRVNFTPIETTINEGVNQIGDLVWEHWKTKKHLLCCI